MNTNEPCALCSQPVELKAFNLNTKEGEQHFCCEGCLSIYQLLNQDKLLPTTNENKNESL